MLIAEFSHNNLNTKIIAIIPCHLASVRFPNKILLDLYGLPMVEHVRRRALLSKRLNKVYIACSDPKIINKLREFKANIVKTKKKHLNGTSRVGEAIQNINCTHLILLQGDEPLLLPNYLNKLYDKIEKYPEIDAWNLTAPITSNKQFKDESIVKCSINYNNEIKSLYRKSDKNNIKKNTNHRKILGIIAFKKNFLNKIISLGESDNEKKFLIEQFRIIDNNFKLKSIKVPISLPSINLKSDEIKVKNYLKKNKNQKKILKSILYS